MRGHAVTDATRRAAVEAYRRGGSLASVLTRFELSSPRVLYEWLAEAGVERRAEHQGAARRAALASVSTSVVDRIPAGSPLLGCHGVSYGVVRPESRELAEALRVACAAREPMEELEDVAILGSRTANGERSYSEHVAEGIRRRRAVAGAKRAGVRVPFDRLVGG